MSKQSWPLEQIDDPVSETKKPDSTTKISNEQFVKCWLDCQSYAMLAEVCNLTISATQARATRLRNAGVKLPSFPRVKRVTKKIDVPGLNSMISESEKPNE